MYKKTIKDIPERIKKLPIQNGFPVPWFVAKIEDKYDFRVVDSSKLMVAVKEGLCWICGEKLGYTFTFILGPMGFINRINSEPPSHKECAKFAIINCPFLNHTEKARRENNMPEVIFTEGHDLYQPEVMVMYSTKSYKLYKSFTNKTPYFSVGDAVQIEWFTEARPSTYNEIVDALELGFIKIKEQEANLAPVFLEDYFRKALIDMNEKRAKKFLGSASKKNA
ncbi:MAG: hypothetical protein WBP82_01015 [Leuconostoc mesenteroides]